MTQKSIRILMLTAEPYPTHRADVSCLFGKYLPRHGVQSDLVTVCEPEPSSLSPWGAGKLLVKKVHGGPAKKNALTFLYHIKQLLRFSAANYDMVQVRDMPVVASLALLLCWFKKLPLIYWMSYPIPDGQIDLAMQRRLSSGVMKFLYPLVVGWAGKLLLYRVVLPKVSHAFVQSDVMKQDLVQRGIFAGKLTPVPMGVDFELLQLFQKDPISLKARPDDCVLVYLGILERVRNIPVLFDMLLQVRVRFPDTKLILAGDTPDVDYRDWLLEKANALGLGDAVVWTGWVDTKVAWNYVLGADIALSPYPRGYLLDSASPTKVAEYLALGVPTIVNDQPDQKFVIEASGAGVAVEYSADLWAHEVIKLLENKELRCSMAEAGPSWIRANRSYENIAKMAASVYKTIIR